MSNGRERKGKGKQDERAKPPPRDFGREVVEKTEVDTLDRMKNLSAEKVILIGQIMGRLLAGRVDKEAADKFIKNGPNSLDLNQRAVGYKISRTELKTAQIRKILDAVRRIKTESRPRDKSKSDDSTRTEEQSHKEKVKYRERCLMIKPQLAYAVGRNDQVKPLYDVLWPCLDKVHDREDFMQLYKLMESILAYHKLNGGE